MQHTNCALADETDAGVRDRLADAGRGRVADWEFLAMPDPDAALAADVDLLRACPQLARRRAGRGLALRRRHRPDPTASSRS